MKDKILLFVIGVLVGAVIATGAFFVYSKLATCTTNSNQQQQMPGGTPPSIPNGQNDENNQPPEKPSGSDTQNSDSQKDSQENN